MVYYYKKKLPSVDDVVIAKVINICEYGIEVSLIEYNGATGYINCSEVSRKKKVNFNKLLTIGKDILVHVLQVDEEKNMIDLSKRTIGDDDVKLFTDTHRSHIQLYNLFKQLYMKIHNIVIEKLSQEELHNFLSLTLFELQTEFENEHLQSKLINKETNKEIIDSIVFDSIEGLDGEQFKSVLDDYIDKKINCTKPELTDSIKLMTYGATGVADIKYTLDFKSFENFTELSADFDIKINYMASSAYSIVICQKDFDIKGNKTINEVNTYIKQEIKKRAMDKNLQNQIVL